MTLCSDYLKVAGTVHCALCIAHRTQCKSHISQLIKQCLKGNVSVIYCKTMASAYQAKQVGPSACRQAIKHCPAVPQSTIRSAKLNMSISEIDWFLADLSGTVL